ncbi:MAG: homoserine dehydrogenase [Oscillospiraceae bacterium]
MAKVAILGIGVVGGGTAQVLTKNRELIARRAGREIDLKYILCRSPRPEHQFADKIVHDIAVIENDPEIEVVAECIGGATLAYDYDRRCLLAGKSVVTSNKELVAKHGRELCGIAREKGVNFLFEGAVGGGIPILRPLAQCLAANEISSVCGILNGTTNYILTEMIMFGKSFEQALREAQEKGYAEADPTADVEGIDAGRKICILADLCFGKNVAPEDISMRGITQISSADIEYARLIGYKIKLLGRAVRTGTNNVCAFVEPHLVSKSCQLANVDGVMNGVTVKGDAIGEAMFFGPGAGALPTASAVVGDLIDCVRDPSTRAYLGWWPSEPGYVTSPDELSCRFMVRTSAGLGELGAAFGNARFISSPSAPAGEYAFVTDYMTGAALRERSAGMTLKSCYRIFD